MTATQQTLTRPVALSNAATAIFAVPAFFLSAPVWVMTVEGLVIAATITALVLVHQQRRRLA
jgi:hypothetical protein